MALNDLRKDSVLLLLNLTKEMVFSTQPSQGRTVLFPIFGTSSGMVLLMRLLIVKSFLVDQLQVFFMVFLRSTKPVAPFVQLSPQ